MQTNRLQRTQGVFGFNFRQRLSKTLSHLYGNNTTDVGSGSADCELSMDGLLWPGPSFASFFLPDCAERLREVSV